MAADPPPADFVVSRNDPDGVAQIWSCRAHLAYTKQVWQAGAQPGELVTVGPANRDADGQVLEVLVHGCKGHLENWPTG